MHIIEINSKYPCVLCFVSFKQIEELGQHYFDTHSHNDLKTLGMRPDALLKTKVGNNSALLSY